jgi:hypothetical protein
MIDSKWTPKKEEFILQCRNAIIKEALLEGFNVIVDDTNLGGNHIENLTQFASLFESQVGEKIEVEINDSFLSVPIEECIERDRKRESSGRKVGRNTILRMAKGAGLIPEDFEFKPYTCDATRYWKEWDVNLPDCIICDLDGTLSLMHNNRSPYEADKCGSDLLNIPVAEILKDIHCHNAMKDMECIGRQTRIILFSGRSDAGREATEKWLEEYDIPYDELHMRVDGDFQKDSPLKTDMYKQHVEGKYNVRYVLDDRDQVVETWRDLGLLCLQVYYGDF